MENATLNGSLSPGILTQDELKKIAAYKAVEYVESGMVIGLGTGSTAKHAVARIGELLRLGKLTNIIGIPTSKMTHELAVSCGIPLSDLNSYPVVDLAIDGADEVDPFMNLVKGRGGSLLREKMIESATKKFIVIVDDSKLVKYLGETGFAIPVEVVPFCWNFSAERLRALFEDKGCVAKLRTYGDNGKPFVTDNENYIVDLYFKEDIGDLSVASDAILRLPGIIDHEMTLISGRGSGLNPNARPFIPAVYRQVEDFSPEWWNLVQSSAWFRDYWMAERQDASFEDPEDDDIKNLLPETFDVGYDEFPYADDEFNEFIGSVDSHGSGYGFRPEAKTTKAPGLDGGTLMKNLNLSSLSPKGSGRGTTANYLMEQTKYNERHAQHTSYNHGGRRIHQPR